MRLEGLEQAGEAFQWLEKACQERSPFLSLLLAVDPRFDNLRSDSMFEKLLNDVFPSFPKEANVKFFLRRASNQ